MNSKKELENEIHKMKSQIKQLNTKNVDVKELINEKSKSEETGSNVLTLFKYVMDENRKTNLILKSMSENITRLEENLNADYEQEDQDPYIRENKPVKVQPISGLDAKIMQIIQLNSNGIACADDIKKQMSYRGRNAASARLNRLYRLGLLERYQLGHKVYYKYDAGKTTNTLIVSPPQ